MNAKEKEKKAEIEFEREKCFADEDHTDRNGEGEFFRGIFLPCM